MTDDSPQANDAPPNIDIDPSSSPLYSPPATQPISPSKRIASPPRPPQIPSVVDNNNDVAAKPIKRSRVTKADNGTWWDDLPLYSPMAGIAKRGSTLLDEFGNSARATDATVGRLAVYSDYEFETFTFFQEIIPNLFLGRYHDHPFPLSFLFRLGVDSLVCCRWE